MTVKIYTIASEVLSTELSKEELLSKVVLLSDYWELQRKVEALAVESANAKSLAESLHDALMIHQKFYAPTTEFECETPDTHAALADIRNEAVNGFITFLKQRAREFPQSVVAESLDVIIVNAEQYSHSQQLRKESGQ